MDNFEFRTLLPIKQKDGKWIFPTEKITNQHESNDSVIANVKTDCESIKSYSLVEKYAKERVKLQRLKINVALLCNSITADPVKNIRSLKELILLLQKSKTKMIVTEKKLIALSLVHVFSDILPGYKIRNMQEENPNVKLKKDTKHLLNHELSLLRYYKKYIDLLHSMVNNMKPKRQRGLTPAKKTATKEIGVIATKCLCKLLVSRYYFNYYKTIIAIIVPLIGNRNITVSNSCYIALETLYKTDKLGEASLEAVRQTVKVVKERNFSVSNDLLKTFLALNLQEVKSDDDKNKKNMKEIRRELNAMSRKEKKQKKKMRQLEQQLRETQAHENKETKSKLQSEIIKKIFWIYFHVLKDDQKIKLITPVLEGLSKFAHLINLEFFDDLSSVLYMLMEKENLGDTEKLYCMQTMFIILSGRAESLNIDPQRLYSHFYQLLLNLNHHTSVEQFQAALKCIELMLIKRKKRITFNRNLAFIKRLCTVSLQVPVHFAISVLLVIRTLILETKNSDILLDTEHIGSSVFLPELEDPEYCNASSTLLWELHLLTRHPNPLISDCAQHILFGCPVQGKLRIPEWLLKLTSIEVLDLFSKHSTDDDFKKIENPRKKLCVRKEISQSVSTVNDDDIFISENGLKGINFAHLFNINESNK